MSLDVPNCRLWWVMDFFAHYAFCCLCGNFGFNMPFITLNSLNLWGIDLALVGCVSSVPQRLGGLVGYSQPELGKRYNALACLLNQSVHSDCRVFMCKEWKLWSLHAPGICCIVNEIFHFKVSGVFLVIMYDKENCCVLSAFLCYRYLVFPHQLRTWFFVMWRWRQTGGPTQLTIIVSVSVVELQLTRQYVRRTWVDWLDYIWKLNRSVSITTWRYFWVFQVL